MSIPYRNTTFKQVCTSWGRPYIHACQSYAWPLRTPASPMLCMVSRVGVI